MVVDVLSVAMTLVGGPEGTEENNTNTSIGHNQYQWLSLSPASRVIAVTVLLSSLPAVLDAVTVIL